MLIKMCFENSGTKDKVNHLEVMRFHPIFKNFSHVFVKLIFKESKLYKLAKGRLLYDHKKENDTVYLILCGKIVLHHEELGALGVLTMNNCLGEESQLKKDLKYKLDSAYSEGETFLLGYEASRWAWMKDLFISNGLRPDFLRWEKFVNTNHRQKYLWRKRQ
jgi:hypothetical protein